MAEVARITLLTDFGTRDGYAAAMRGVIAAIAPRAAVDDASHDLPPGGVLEAAWALERYWRIYPPGTVHVAVIDPGVGSARRAIVIEVRGRRFVGPDNGVFTLPLADDEGFGAYAIENERYLREPVSATFHGRDVFAPVAAHLVAGVPPREFGPPVHDPVRLAFPEPHREAASVSGEVILADRFGNLVTNIPGGWVGPDGTIEVAGRVVGPLARTYADVAPGGVLALVGSTDRLEISVRDGSAADLLGLGRGANVRVTSR